MCDIGYTGNGTFCDGKLGKINSWQTMEATYLLFHV